jgi:hypothetical protein
VANGEKQRRWAPGDRLAPWIIQIAGITMVFAAFGAAVFLNLAPEQAALFATTGGSMILLGRSFDIGGK